MCINWNRSVCALIRIILHSAHEVAGLHLAGFLDPFDSVNELTATFLEQVPFSFPLG